MAAVGGIALHGAPDTDIGSKDARHTPIHAMQLDITQDIVDELLYSTRSGRPLQILFGRTPQLKYGDKTHHLQTAPEAYRYELYQSSGADGDDDNLEFAGLMSHSLAVQKAQDVTAGVDTALEQLRSSMAAISEFKQANKTIVGDATPMRTPGHRRFPSKNFKPQHFAPATLGSPMPNAPPSPMPKPPTSRPTGSHDAILRALRTPLIHLLAVQPSRDGYLAETCRTSLANVRELLPKIAKRSSDDTDKWQLTDKSFREVNPWNFSYKNVEDREHAINGAIKSFDRLRLAKDDGLWQILLPVEERGQGKCLSRLNVKAPEPKPSTPMHKMPKMTDKKAALSKKVDDKDTDKDARKVKEAKESTEPKPKKPVKERISTPAVKEVTKPASATASTTPATKSSAPPNRNTSSTEAPKVRNKKMAPTGNSATPRVKPKVTSRDVSQRDRHQRPTKPAMPINTKPKNPSPLSASPPVNASDFEDNHPVHKALSGGPSPAKTSSGNSDRSLKRKANDIDSDIHNHNLAAKQPRLDRSTPNHTPSSTNGRLSGSTPSSASSLKRKTDDSSSSSYTPTSKIRKVNNIDTGLASRYTHHNSQISPGDSSSATTSPSLPSLSFRQTVELSQKFQKYYKRYEELYWQLTEASIPPTESQRNDLMKMHKKLEEMKREIKAGAGVHH